MRTSEVQQRTGATARQLEHWAARGYIPGAGAQQGSGNYRDWTKAQVEFIDLMLSLVDVGFSPSRAAELVPHLLNGDTLMFGEKIKMTRV